MSVLLLLAAAASPALPAAPSRTEARAVVDAQRAAPPRTGDAGGLSAAEAALVMQRYLASIGKRVERRDSGFAQGQGQ